MPRFLSIAARSNVSSISFSGAGFLGCYHLGVAACLLKHGIIKPTDNNNNTTSTTSQQQTNNNMKPYPILTGVSAGSLTAAGILAGINPEDGMNIVYEASRKTKQNGGALDVLRPGFSLVDSIEQIFIQTLQQSLGGSADTPGDYDNDLLLRRIQHGKLLRVGLTIKKEYVKLVTPQQCKENAYVYVDQYRDLRDVVSACMLSCYVPTLTGTMNPSSDSAVGRAWQCVKEMEVYGCIKHGLTQETIRNTSASNHEDLKDDDVVRYWDGGLSNMWPEIDDETIIVSPMNGSFSNPAICPPIDQTTTESSDENDPFFKLPSQFQLTDKARVGLNADNASVMLRMAFSSEDHVLEAKFRDGYDDALRFLTERSMLSIYTA